MTLDSHLPNVTKNAVTDCESEALREVGGQDADKVVWLNQVRNPHHGRHGSSEPGSADMSCIFSCLVPFVLITRCASVS